MVIKLNLRDESGKPYFYKTKEMLPLLKIKYDQIFSMVNNENFSHYEEKTNHKIFEYNLELEKVCEAIYPPCREDPHHRRWLASK